MVLQTKTCLGGVGNGSPRVNFGVKSPSFGAKRPNFCIINVKSLHFVVLECEGVNSQKGFPPLV